MKNGRTLALFDFDGTISTRDSFIDFFEYICGRKRLFFLFAWASPLILLYFLKLYSGKKLKEHFFRKLIKEWSIEKFEVEAQGYYENRMKKILKDSALEKIREHKKIGDEVVLVSASAEQWLIPFVNDLGMKLIATKLEIKDGFFTGRIEGDNCIGKEKVVRILKKYDPADFDQIYAYGDSSGDREMLELATCGFYRVFH